MSTRKLFIGIAFAMLFSTFLKAGSVDGDLRISIIPTYNLIVDSNVESPSSYGPYSVHLGVTICNDGSDDLTEVEVNIGDYAAVPVAPGIFPERTVSQGGYSGTFSLEMVQTTESGTRQINTIAAGECVTQYWLVTYPTLDANGNSVAGKATIDDDLWLEYDAWVTANDNGTPLEADDNNRVYMRREISSMANKIWPNGTNKVPQEYLDAIEGSIGWRPGGSNVAGEIITSEGIWFDLGVINQGFDNDGDQVPDYNVFMQPVGDPSLYDADCIQLVRTYGLLIIEKTDGTEELVPFEDQTFFPNLPPDNNGATGLVYYDFAILNAPCYVQLSPYQSVASGADNEKFNGDYGIFTGSITTTTPDVSFDATGPSSTNYDTDIPYILTATNNTLNPIGLIQQNAPLVISAEIPAGTNYVAASATTSGSLPTGSSTIQVKYSTDNGSTWSSTEPADPTTVTNLQWWLDVALPVAESFSTTFKIQAPEATYTLPFILAESGLSFGNRNSFVEDDVLTLISGNNSIGDKVFADDGAGGGTANDGIHNGTEPGMDGVDIYIHYDTDANGILTAEDIIIDTVASSGGGTYSFSNLPDGNYLVEVCKICGGIGGLTTPEIYSVSIDPSSQTSSPIDTTTIDFGFTPALSVTKTITSASPIYENQEVTFDLAVENLIAGVSPPAGPPPSETPVTAWAGTTTTGAGNNWASLSQCLGAPDDIDATTNWSSAQDNLHLKDFFVATTGEPITKVELVIKIENTTALVVTDYMQATVEYGGTGIGTIDLIADTLNNYYNNEGIFAADITSFRSWDWPDFASGSSLQLDLTNMVFGTPDGQNTRVDAIGYRINHYESGGAGDCGIYDLWINYDDVGNFLPSANLFGEPDDSYATDNTWGTWTDCGVFNNVPTTGNIEQVEIIARFYYTGTLTDDDADVRLTDNGTPLTTFKNIPFSEIQPFNSQANAGTLSLDVTSDKTSWAWSDFTSTFDSGIGVQFRTSLAASNDGAIPFIDGLGLRISTDEFCPGDGWEFDLDKVLIPVPLTDDYNPDSLEFVTASTYPDSIDEVNGKIYWNDVGPIYPEETITISTTFRVKELAANTATSASNTAISNGATYANDDPANSDTSTVSFTIEPTGSISGLLWGDTDADGWQGSIGYESATDFLVPNAVLAVYSCTNVAANGSCSGTETLLQTISTDANGAYTFNGLPPNMHYRVYVVEPSLPGTVSQTGDPDDDPVNGSGNGGTCGTGGGNEPCDADWTNDKSWFEIGVDSWGGESWEVNNINFGYYINPTIMGNVWEDVNGDGLQQTGENGIENVTVELQSSGCTPGIDCPTVLTDVDGTYTFEDLTASVNFNVVVIESSLPSTASWIETAESDLSIDNNISVVLLSGEISNGNNFAYQPTGTSSLGDNLFYDFNGDGIQDTSDEGIPNITIHLYKDVDGNGKLRNNLDAYIGSTSTDINGYYSFDNLPASEYLIVIDEKDVDFPVDAYQTADPDEDGRCLDCDGLSSVDLGVATTVDSIDFGYQAYGVGKIGELVWIDSNGDSIQVGIQETGIANITVELWGDFNQDGTYVNLTSEISDSLGYYVFENLADANYKVIVDSTDTDLPKDGANNFFSPTTTTVYDVQITNGDTSSTTNFGFAQLGSIGDFIFWDANNNGTFDITEPGIPDVTVYICSGTAVPCNSGNALESTITSDGTDGNNIGFYRFYGYAPGDYTIGVETASGPLSTVSQTADPNSDGFACDDPDIILLGYPTCDNHYTQSINYGTIFSGADFGYQPDGVIGNWIWLDADADGVQDSLESGIFNVEVILTNITAITVNGVPYPAGTYKDTVYTDLDGYYNYTTMPDGTYDIDVTQPIDRIPTFDADGGLDNSVQVVINAGEVTSIDNSWCSGSDCSLDADFGYKLNGTFSLSGFICIDDGSEDGFCSTGGEMILKGDLVYLTNSAGEFLGQTTVDVGGIYTFDNLPADTYTVSMGTTDAPYNISTPTTTGVTNTGTSVYQSTVLASNLSGFDFAYKYDDLIDFGDLPTSYLITKMVDGGAYHTLPTTPTLYLGTLIDSETTPTQNATASGDPSDDGVVFNSPNTWIEGVDGGSIDVEVVGSGWLVAWVDFNQDGDFSDPGEDIISQAATAGTSSINFDVPTGAVLSGQTFSRIRLLEAEPAFPRFSYTGQSANGEVEDFLIDFSILPIDLANFTGNGKDCEVVLNWKSLSEENFNYYGLQWSDDGHFFKTVDIIEGKGGNQANDYSYATDVTPGHNYFRLYMEDLDGSIIYSNVIDLETDCDQSKYLTVYPNPLSSGDELNVAFKTGQSKVQIVVMDLLGRTLSNFEMETENIWNRFQLDTKEMPAGTYSISIFSKTRPMTQKFNVFE